MRGGHQAGGLKPKETAMVERHTVLIVGLARQVAMKGFVTHDDVARVLIALEEIQKVKTPITPRWDDIGYPTPGPFGDDCHGSLWHRPTP